MDHQQQKLIEKARDRWIQKLTDLSRRNNLLFYRQKQKGTLELFGVNTENTSALLQGQSVELADLFQQEEKYKESLEKIQFIYKRSIDILEERGLKTLFLSYGMVTWTSKDNGRNPQAPLLLIPIAIEKKGSISLRRQGEGQINPVLLYALENQYGYKINVEEILDGQLDIPENEIPPIETVAQKLSDIVYGLPGFKIDRHHGVLSNFSFQKMSMVRDLKENFDLLSSNSLILALAGDISAQQNIKGNEKSVDYSDARQIDLIHPENEFLIFDADSSQQIVIHSSLQGKNGIIQGPPGTGKSQTIANLITSFCAEGKKVLFVAEKRAALEVVRNRLAKVGLEHLTLDLYNPKISQKSIMEQFLGSLTLISNVRKIQFSEVHDDLIKRRNALNNYVRALHVERLPYNLSIREIQEELLELEKRVFHSKIRFEKDKLKEISESQGEIQNLLSEISNSKLLDIFLENSLSGWAKADFTSTQEVESAIALAAELYEKLSNYKKEKIVSFPSLLVLSKKINKTIYSYNDKIFKENLPKLIADLRSRDTGLFTIFNIFNAALNQSRDRVKMLRKAGDCSDEKLVSDLREISDQLRQFNALVPDNTFPKKEYIDGLVDLAKKLARLNAIVKQRNLEEYPLEELLSLLEKLISEKEIAWRCLTLNINKQKLINFGLDKFLKNIKDNQEEIEFGENSFRLTDQFRWVWLTSCLEVIYAEEPILRTFDGKSHDHIVSEFRELDIKRLELAKSRVIRKHAEKAVQTMNKYGEEESIVRREANKKSRHLSLRKIIRQAPNVLTSLRPCWMVSPLSVSQLIDAKQYFDVVIFDEASQVLPEDAICSLMRAKQVLIAGDNKQLPPTNFFITNIDGDDSDEDISSMEGFESLLDLSSSFLHSWKLRWHYRSRSEELIAFSNHHIYNNDLITFPGVKDTSAIFHILIPHQLGEDGQEESSSNEVTTVVEMVLKHAQESPSDTLGVITMGIKHAQRIEFVLEQELKQRPELSAFFSDDKNERFFVKNIERVQGDERDSIILSIGYGKDRSGKLPHRFGPLLYQGGERRLNVAISRARHRMTLVSSFDHYDIDLNRSRARGVELLKLYLAYASSGGKILGDKGCSEIPLNPFEQDIFDALKAQNIPLIPQWGVSQYRIDMVAQHPERRGQFVLAIECDGATYHSSPTARDRDRLRQEHLESLGWRFHRIWSLDWFNNREEEIQRAVQAFNEAVKDFDIKLPKVLPTSIEVNILQEKYPKPDIPLRSYHLEDVMQIVEWILSDGCLITDEELLKQSRKELGFKRSGRKINDVIQLAIKKIRNRQSIANSRANSQ
ncbi:DUF4011 domain-containing protein [Synechocystis sp. PCC 7339]|uniref:AAA domain-containing protein n=1 Tax=unclassified Synechocystis TaxID=2640012 RepID=UPI001BB091DA|nr:MULTISPECIES: AAA domain-containing protein [unclassified Synechocystis]QUS61785.1 DUF4011 domain-containing protein [Synechocystis sp. PCC 7338]UAJ73982.1 DUF4011 domain-containing protein [Synechocystis sp. PCC 7339]